jgi:two-component system sensor histidine kinase QseC
VRHELERIVSWRILHPVFYVVPLLALLIWFGVGRGLAPLKELARQVRWRSPDNLEAVPDPAMAEARPLVESLNKLLGRLREALDNERRFTADAAHELRTPLAVIKTNAQVAQRARNEEEYRSALESLVAGVDRCSRLVQQLMTLARLDPDGPSLEHRRLNLAKICAETLAEVANAALEKNIDLSLDADAPVPVRAQAAPLAILVRNLAENAVRYTPAGGHVRVSARIFDGFPELRVEDSGPGIPASERTRVFDRFYRLASGEGLGSGLGLSIVRRIADLHGATIALDEAPGGGLAVVVRFPPAGPVPQPAGRPRASRAARAPARERIES